MKEKVIEVAGKTWKTLAEKGETNLSKLPTTIKENDAIVYQALGWLAREDKIAYRVKNSETFVSLIESELQNFKNSVQNRSKDSSIQSESSKKKRPGL